VHLLPSSTANKLVCVICLRPGSVWHIIIILSRFTLVMIVFKKLGLVSNELSDSCTYDLNDNILFRWLASAADLTKLICKTVTKSFFKMLDFNESSTLSEITTEYPGFSVDSGNFETESRYKTGSKRYGISLVPPPWSLFW
jgi:hypothetical protein